VANRTEFEHLATSAPAARARDDAQETVVGERR
jgi:hypothetical protein